MLYDSEAPFTSNRMTLADVREHVYFLADEGDGANFPESAINRLLNMGFRKVVNDIGYHTRVASTRVLPDERAYPLIDPILDGNENAIVSNVDLLNADGSYVKSLTSVDFDAYNEEVGIPDGYSVVGGVLYLSPVPSGDYRFRVTYKSQFPTISNSTDVVPLSDEQIEVAVYYAVWQMKLRDDEVGVADRWRNEYEERLKLLGSAKPGVYKP